MVAGKKLRENPTQGFGEKSGLAERRTRRRLRGHPLDGGRT